jgi:integrase
MINGADQVLRWYVEDVWGHFGRDHTLAAAGAVHLPTWAGKLSPHVLRHYCASQLYLAGMDLLAIQELLGHSWIATTMRYVHVHSTRIEQAHLRGQQLAAQRWKGLTP